MKILFLDYLSYPGHKVFNKIHINALKELGCRLKLVGRKKQFDIINNEAEIEDIPNWMYKIRVFKPITERLFGIIILLWASVKYNLRDYDIIILPTYDMFSTFFFRSKKPTIVVDHSGFALSSRLKILFMKLMSRSTVHIALNEAMYERLQVLLPKSNVRYIPHGISTPSKLYSQPLFVGSDYKYIFCPINRSIDYSLLKILITSKKVRDLMNRNNCKILIKDTIIKEDSSEIFQIIPSNIARQEYDYLMENSVSILLPYDADYQYQCSGILFESIARKKPVITSQIEVMNSYKKYGDIYPCKNDNDFLNAIQKCLKKTIYDYETNAFNPVPYWRELLSSLK